MPRLRSRGLDRFVGMIAAAGFSSGEQVVVGMWRRSPIGRLVDVMWIRPDGERVLLAPTDAARDYIGRLYGFDDERVVAIRGGWTGARVEVHAPPLEIELAVGERGLASWLFALRPRALRRSPAWLAVEDRLVEPLAPLVLGDAPGVRIAGTTASGRREWYSIEDHRPLVDGRLRLDGRDAGYLTELRPGLGVGISDFPRHPAMVNVTTLIEPADPGR